MSLTSRELWAIVDRVIRDTGLTMLPVRVLENGHELLGVAFADEQRPDLGEVDIHSLSEWDAYMQQQGWSGHPPDYTPSREDWC